MDTELKIRQADESDIERVLQLLGDLSSVYEHDVAKDAVQGRSREELLTVFRDDRQHILVAEIGANVVGTLTVIIIPNIGHQGDPWAALTNVVVNEAFRGRGIGAELMAEAGRIASERRCYKLILSSNLARKRAHEFYRRLGWQESHIGFSLPLSPTRKS